MKDTVKKNKNKTSFLRPWILTLTAKKQASHINPVTINLSLCHWHREAALLLCFASVVLISADCLIHAAALTATGVCTAISSAAKAPK